MKYTEEGGNDLSGKQLPQVNGCGMIVIQPP